jgi:hypothetical protein
MKKSMWTLKVKNLMMGDDDDEDDDDDDIILCKGANEEIDANP